MIGYLHDEQRTSTSFDGNGWLHSDDIASADEKGKFEIIGKDVEQIFTTGGLCIYPLQLEQTLLKELPVLSNVLVVGDQRDFLCCIFTLKVNYVRNKTLSLIVKDWCQQILGSTVEDIDDVFDDNDLPKRPIFNAIQTAIEHVNKTTPNANNIKNWILLPTKFSTFGGELNHLQNMKRKGLTQKYMQQIEDMYQKDNDLSANGNE